MKTNIDQSFTALDTCSHICWLKINGCGRWSLSHEVMFWSCNGEVKNMSANNWSSCSHICWVFKHPEIHKKVLWGNYTENIENLPSNEIFIHKLILFVKMMTWWTVTLCSSICLFPFTSVIMVILIVLSLVFFVQVFSNYVYLEI